MKIKKTVLLATALVVSTSFGVFAGANIENITAQINYAMKIKINGNEYNAVDKASGAALKPITYKGRTYVPLRSIGEAFGVAVDYDSKSSTVILGTREGKGVPISSLVPVPTFDTHGNNGPNGATKDKEILAVNGKTYDYGFYFNKLTDELYYASDVKLQTSKKYQKLMFEASAIGNADVKIQIIDSDIHKGTLIKEVVVTAGETPKAIEADIGTSDDVFIRLSSTKDGTEPKAVLGEIYVK